MSPAVMSLDGQKVKEVSEANATAKSVRNYLAERERNTPVTDLPRTKMEILRAGGTILEEDFVEYWKALDRLGVGTYFKGRGINKDTFTWKYSLKIVAQVAVSGQTVNLEKHLQKHKPTAPKSATPKLALVKKDTPAPRKTTVLKTVHVYLRPDFMIELNVPSDFSKEEARQICQSISSLAG